MKSQTLRQKLEQRWSALKTERSHWIETWRDVSELMAPDRGRFERSERNKGPRNRARRIVNTEALQSLRTLGSGMASGLSSPDQPFFRLATEDPALRESGPVKAWLEDVERVIYRILGKSNFYQTRAALFRELGGFGTCATFQVEDFNAVQRWHPLTVGEYAAALGPDGRVDVLYRELDRTVGELVQDFGLANVSQTVRNLYDQGSLEAWVHVMHAVEPQSPRVADAKGARGRPYVSIYWEPGDNTDRLLRVSGFDSCPAHVCRWDLRTSDVYGWGPGFDALGPTKQLQLMARKLIRAWDTKYDPPLQGPASLAQNMDRMPGAYNAVSQGQRVESIYDPRAFALTEGEWYWRETREEVQSLLYADLFRMIDIRKATRGVTAREIAEHHERDMLQLGPVLTRVYHELQSPEIEQCFNTIMAASAPMWPMGRGMVPPPPPELEGQEIKLEYISALAQAQQAVQAGPIYRLMEAGASLAQVAPESLDKLDTDQMLDELAERLGAPARATRDDRAVAAMREARAQQQQQMQQMAMLQAGADAAGKLGRAQVTPETALGQIVAAGTA